MDFKSSKYLQDPTPFFHSLEEVRMSKENPFADWFPDSMTRKNGAPSTMGRPGYTLSTVGSRKNFPSKWDDAEKWVMSGHESPAHGVIKPADFMHKQQEKLYKTEAFSNGSRITKESRVFHGPKNASLDHNQASNGVSALESCDVLLKDKFTNEVEPAFPKTKGLEPMSEAFVFKTPMENSTSKVKLEVIQEAKSKDMGTEMTPTGSNTTSRCPTPLKSLSPPRHNTPLSMKDQSSSSFDIIELKECHLAKIQPWTPFDSITSKWSSREEEEEEISKSLRHFEIKSECLESISGPRPSAWEEKEMSQPCIRYQIQEAKIQAWVKLQKAKAEAQSRKLEVKIQKMRSKHEEKMMKKMMLVHRKAEELRAAAQLEHTETTTKSNKTMNRHPSVHFSGHQGSCGCLIGN